MGRSHDGQDKTSTAVPLHCLPRTHFPTKNTNVSQSGSKKKQFSISRIRFQRAIGSARLELTFTAYSHIISKGNFCRRLETHDSPMRPASGFYVCICHCCWRCAYVERDAANQMATDTVSLRNETKCGCRVGKQRCTNDMNPRSFSHK